MLRSFIDSLNSVEPLTLARPTCGRVSVFESLWTQLLWTRHSFESAMRILQSEKKRLKKLFHFRNVERVVWLTWNEVVESYLRHGLTWTYLR